MQQKTIWMPYSFIGISMFLLTLGCGKKKIEYRMTVDLVYTNQTDSIISFDILESISSTNVSIVKLLPSQSSKVYSYNYSGVSEKISPTTCCNSFLQNVYSTREVTGYSKIIKLNDTLCLTHVNERSTEIANYEILIISDRHYKYTYNFNKNDLKNALKCK